MRVISRLLLFLTVLHTLSAQTPAQTEFFEKRVRPVFASKCSGCHNAKTRMGGLDLSSGEAFQSAAEAGSLLSPDKPEQSRLLRVLGWEDQLKMPPAGKLPAEELQAVAEWVKAGAVWPGVVKVAAAPKASAGIEDRKNFWSFQPVNPGPAPAVKNAAWVKSPIDRFILARLEEKGLQPAPPADKATLLRRVTFDLTGLPPSEAEVREFLA